MAYETPLKREYTIGRKGKATHGKPGGNSGNVGRRARAKKRGHGGGQETPEHVAERKRRSDEARERRKKLEGS